MPRFPHLGRVRQGFAQRALLQPAAHARQLLQLRHADSGHGETALVNDGDERIGGEAIQCFYAEVWGLGLPEPAPAPAKLRRVSALRGHQTQLRHPHGRLARIGAKPPNWK